MLISAVQQSDSLYLHTRSLKIVFNASSFCLKNVYSLQGNFVDGETDVQRGLVTYLPMDTQVGSDKVRAHYPAPPNCVGMSLVGGPSSFLLMKTFPLGKCLAASWWFPLLS